VPNSYFLKDIYMVWREGRSPDQRAHQILERFKTRTEWQNLIENNSLQVVRTHKYNPKWEVEGLKTFIYRSIRPFIPLNLSYCFVFICKRKNRLEKNE